MVDVAIVGVGMHAFGRFDGVSALDMGVVAAHGGRSTTPGSGGAMSSSPSAAAATARRPTTWSASSASPACSSPTSTTGAPPAARRSRRRRRSSRPGCTTSAWRSATTSTSGERSRAVTAAKGPWYGASGLRLTTQFFGMKIQRYMHEHGISRNTLAKVADKAFRNGSQNEMAWRRKPLSEEQILEAPMLSDPLTQYMFCNPGEGAVALVVCRAEQAHRYSSGVRSSSARVSIAPGGSAASRCSRRRSRPTSRAAPRSMPRRQGVRAWRASGRRTSIWRSCRTPSRVRR